VTEAAPPSPSEILARLDRIPCWPYPRRVLLVIGAGIFFAFFDVVTIAAALPMLIEQLGVSSEEASQTISFGLFGYVVGAFLISRLADRGGRRLGLLVSVTLFSGGSLMTATSTELWHVVLWRFVSGMGIGADIAGMTTYLAEVSPKKIRGRYTAISVGMGFLGIALVPFVAEALVPRFEWGWRALFALGAVGGVVIALGRRSLAPSPRWLLAMGRDTEALAVVEAAERYATESRGQTLPTPVPEPIPAPVSVRELLRSPLHLRVLLFACTWLLYYIGNYAWLSLMPELYVKHGMKLSSSLWLTGLTSLGFVAGSGLAVVLIDRVERKWTCAGVAGIWAALLLVVGWLPSVPVITVAGFFASASISLFVPIMYTYTGENFPTAVRATSVAITDGLGHLGGVFCATIVWAAYDTFAADALGYPMALTAMAATGFLAALLLTLGRRTKGTSL
jgi:putative MFS transporter